MGAVFLIVTGLFSLALFSVALMPAYGVSGLFLAWLFANGTVVALAYLFALKN